MTALPIISTLVLLCRDINGRFRAPYYRYDRIQLLEEILLNYCNGSRTANALTNSPYLKSLSEADRTEFASLFCTPTVIDLSSNSSGIPHILVPAAVPAIMQAEYQEITQYWQARVDRQVAAKRAAERQTMDEEDVHQVCLLTTK